jgi:hypothetical protein
MGIGTKAAAAAVATIMGASALLAGTSTATAAPAPSVSGKAVLAWNAKCPSMSQSLKPVRPASNQGGRLSLPVTAATGRQISLGGALQLFNSGAFYGNFVDPAIPIAGTNAANFVVTWPDQQQLTNFPLFHVADFKKAGKAKTREWTGILQAPIAEFNTVPATFVADLLGRMCGAPIVPGDTLGTIKVTVKSS